MGFFTGVFDKDRQFYKTLLHIAIPIAAQNLVASSLNMVDTIMIGRLGETEIAAVGLANQVFFLFMLFLFGVSSGSAIFTAQFWGKRDIESIRKVLGIGLATAGMAALFFSLLAILWPAQVLSIYTKDVEVIRLGSAYLRIVGFSYLMTSITFSYAFILRSTEQAKLPMLMSMIALGINTALNYVLIFGHFGFSAMGVQGAAIATVISRFIEMILMLTMVYLKQLAPAASFKEMTSQTWAFIARFYRTTIPVILNETLWSLGVTVYAMVYGRIGTGAVAAVNIASTVERIGMVLFFGMANASAVMIGNRIGAGEEEKAYVYAKRFLILGPLFGFVMGFLLIVTSGPILSMYNISSDVYTAARSILMVMGFTMVIKVFNLINCIGVLRSGGDTKFSLVLDITGIWCIGVPIAVIFGLVLGFPIYWVILLVTLEEIYKVTLGIRRFITKKWIHNLVKNMGNEDLLQDSISVPMVEAVGEGMN